MWRTSSAGERTPSWARKSPKLAGASRNAFCVRYAKAARKCFNNSRFTSGMDCKISDPGRFRRSRRWGVDHRSTACPLAVARKARDPATDRLPVLLVGRAELAAQRRLFVTDDEEIHRDEPAPAVKRERPRAGNEQFTQEDRGNADVHRVPDVAVQS